MVDRYLAGFAYLSLPDPDGYQTSLIEVMQRYPKWAGEYAIVRPNRDNANLPVSSIVLRIWLEEIVGPHRRARQWESEAKEQLEERSLIEGTVSQRETYEEVCMDMAQRGMPLDGKKHVNIDEEVKAFKARHNLTDEQWDSIPDGDINSRRLDRVARKVLLGLRG